MPLRLLLRSCFKGTSFLFARLTALHGNRRRLQPQNLAVRLRDGDPEHHPHPRVLPPDVRLSFLQLDVGVTQLQDAGAVDATRKKAPFIRTHRLNC